MREIVQHARGSSLPDALRAHNLDLRLARRELEQLTFPLVERSLRMVERVMGDAGLAPRDIDEVMLVGGQTRMPIIQRMLGDWFGKPPSKGVHPDEAVAVGAALYGWSLQEILSLPRPDRQTLVASVQEEPASKHRGRFA